MLTFRPENDNQVHVDLKFIYWNLGKVLIYIVTILIRKAKERQYRSTRKDDTATYDNE